MGNLLSNEEDKRKEHERERERERERKEQERVKNDIRGLQNKMVVHSRAHNLSAEYYGSWNSILFVLLLVVGRLSAGYKALRWKTPQADDSKSRITVIVIFALGFAAFVIKQCYRWVADSHEKHYKAERNCQSIADRARPASDSNESSSSLRNRYYEMLKDKGNSSEIRYEQWAYDKASKK